MKRKLLFGLLVLTLVALPLLAACGEAETTTTPTPGQTPTPTPTPPEVIEITMATSSPQVAPLTQLYRDWADKLNEQSGGRVTVTIYYAGSLLGSPEMFRGVASGIADVAEGFYPESVFLGNYNTLPFLGWKDEESATVIWRELYNKFPEIKEEWDVSGIKLLYPRFYMGGRQWVHCTNKLVKTLEDFKGMKVNAAGEMAKWVKLVDAAAVRVFFPDMYMSLEKGIINAHISSFGAPLAAGITELTPYRTFVGSATMAFMPQIVNWDFWNGLPPDIQKIMEDLDPWFVQEAIALERANDDFGVESTKAMGHTYYDLPADELQRWMDIAKPIHEDWIAEMEAKGLPARAVSDELMRLIAESNK